MQGSATKLRMTSLRASKVSESMTLSYPSDLATVKVADRLL
jgi:hypothetical protein